MKIHSAKSLKKSLSQSIASLKAGDILGCSGACIQSDVINVVTYGVPRFSLSHVMILAEDENNDLLIFESTTQCGLPCAIRKVQFSGTQAHYIKSRLESYRGKVWHYPLAVPLRREESRRLSSHLISEIGTPYDLAGGELAVGKIWSMLNAHLHPESLSALFCSEWVADGERTVNRFATKNASRWTPNYLMRTMLKRGNVKQPRRIK